MGVSDEGSKDVTWDTHEWAVFGHVHLQPWHETQLREGIELDLQGAPLCAAEVGCLICERNYSDAEAQLPCDGPPVAYARNGEPLHVRDN